MATIPDIRDLLTNFASEVRQFTIEYIGETFGGVTLIRSSNKINSNVVFIYLQTVVFTCPLLKKGREMRRASSLLQEALKGHKRKVIQ